MEEATGIMYVETVLFAFCGLVLSFALLFAGCWCFVTCSFFCVKVLYRRTLLVNVNGNMLSMLSFRDVHDQ